MLFTDVQRSVRLNMNVHQKEKTIGLLFEEMKGITIEGNGATLMFHGKMTMIAFVHCQQIKLKNLKFDFQRPGGTEMTYTQIDKDGVEVKIHQDSYYEIVDNKIHLYGEGWRSNKNHCIEYDPNNDHFSTAKAGTYWQRHPQQTLHQVLYTSRLHLILSLR